MALFGSGYPIIFSPSMGSGLALTESAQLPAGGIVVRKPDKPVRDMVINKSLLTGKKHIHYKGNHILFELILLGIDNNILQFLSIIEGQEIWYIPYNHNANRQIPCFLTSVTHFHYKELNFNDAVIIKMQTIDYWVESSSTILDANGLTPSGADDGYLIDELGNYIVDELGNKIIINLTNKEE